MRFLLTLVVVFVCFLIEAHLPHHWLKSMPAICSSDNFQDQMKRELSYREEMVQQLHIVRGETNKAEGADTAALPSLSTRDLLIYCGTCCRRDWWLSLCAKCFVYTGYQGCVCLQAIIYCFDAQSSLVKFTWSTWTRGKPDFSHNLNGINLLIFHILIKYRRNVYNLQINIRFLSTIWIDYQCAFYTFIILCLGYPDTLCSELDQERETCYAAEVKK